MKSFCWIICAVSLVACLYFSANRARILMHAERAVGTVDEILARNDRCGEKNREYFCTRFSALVSFTSKRGVDGELTLSAGTARGHNQPVSRASRAEGQPVKVVYLATNPSEALEDNFWGIWGTPLVMIFIAVVSGIVAKWGKVVPGDRFRSRRGGISWSGGVFNSVINSGR